jgi:hypothetical protein
MTIVWIGMIKGSGKVLGKVTLPWSFLVTTRLADQQIGGPGPDHLHPDETVGEGKAVSAVLDP